MLVNHDQNLESRSRLLKVCLCVKLELNNCRKLLFNFCKAWSIENLTQSIKTRADCFFCRISNSAQAHMTCRVLCFASSIRGKTLATFWRLLICCVCESLVRSRDVYFHTHLRLSRSRLMSRTWWLLRLLFQELKEKHKWEYLRLLWIKKRSSPWTRSCHMVVVVSFLLKVAIGC